MKSLFLFFVLVVALASAVDYSLPNGHNFFKPTDDCGGCPPGHICRPICRSRCHMGCWPVQRSLEYEFAPSYNSRGSSD